MSIDPMTPKSQELNALFNYSEVQPSEKTEKIAFRGTEKYRAALQQEALTNGVKVQRFIEDAIAEKVLGGRVGADTPKVDALSVGNYVVTPEELPLIEAALYLLREGKPNYRDMLKATLKLGAGKKPRKFLKHDAA